MRKEYFWNNQVNMCYFSRTPFLKQLAFHVSTNITRVIPFQLKFQWCLKFFLIHLGIETFLFLEVFKVFLCSINERYVTAQKKK